MPHQTTLSTAPLDVFLSYAHEDVVSMEKLRRFLADLQRQGLITLYVDKNTEYGLWEPEIQKRLHEADVVLFVLSDHLLASDYCMDNEFAYAVPHFRETQRPIPIALMVDHIEIETSSFRDLVVHAQKDGKLLAASMWPEEKLAYGSVVRAVYELAIKHQERQQSSNDVRSESFGPVTVVRGDGFARTQVPVEPKWRWANRPSTQLCARADLVSRIRSYLERDAGVPVVLTGHGGMGKSTAAYLYAVEHAAQYDHVAKIAADTPATLAEEWRALASWLGQPASDVQTANYAMANWLADESRWLLVLDNAYSGEVLDRLPRVPMGDVLVTTREDLRPGAREFRRLTVAELQPDEAEALMLEASGGADPEAVRDICRWHNYDPLSLEKALLDLRRGMPPRRYLARLRDERRSQ